MADKGVENACNGVGDCGSGGEGGIVCSVKDARRGGDRHRSISTSQSCSSSASQCLFMALLVLLASGVGLVVERVQWFDDVVVVVEVAEAVAVETFFSHHRWLWPSSDVGSVSDYIYRLAHWQRWLLLRDRKRW
jgi:hypothetical protein